MVIGRGRGRGVVNEGSGKEKRGETGEGIEERRRHEREKES